MIITEIKGENVYFGWKTLAIDHMFAAFEIMRSPVHMKLKELVGIKNGTTGDI